MASEPVLDAKTATAIAENPDATPEQLDSAVGINNTVNLLLAMHPNASAALLENLSHSKDKATRMKVAAHPNATERILNRLFPNSPYPPVFAHLNSAFDWRLLENPEIRFKLGTWHLRRIIKRTDCPKSFLKWAANHGSEGEQLAVAIHPKVSKDVLKLLAQRDGLVGEAARGPRLNDKQVLVGDYPQTLDLRKYAFDTEIFIHFSDEFEKAAKEGRPPQPNIYISNNDSVETIYFPFDQAGYDYAVVANLPNLRELYICRKDETRLWTGELKWLICQHLPNLRKITIEGDIRWLQLEDMPSLETIDVSKCKDLDYFSIKNAPAIKNVNVKNCKKLRVIADLPLETQSNLGITKQVQKTQGKSKRNGQIYKNMTFTDIDTVLANINHGIKLATRAGLFYKGEVGSKESGFCYGRENDPEFKNFSFRLLRPLEAVYTGGTGETYAYELLSHDYFDGQYGICSGTGNSTQEDCLDYALHSIDMAEWPIPRSRNLSSKQILAFLNQLIAEECHSPRPE